MGMDNGMYINPFDADEAKMYIKDKEIKPVSDLCVAFTGKNIEVFIKVIANTNLSEDNYMKLYINILKDMFYSKVIRLYLKPYSAITITRLSKLTTIPHPKLLTLIKTMVIDKNIDMMLDECTGILSLVNNNNNVDGSMPKERTLGKWLKQLQTLN